MAKIILIDEKTLREGMAIGDYVDAYDDNVVLGPAYDTYKILQVKETAAEVKQAIRAQEPEIKVAYKSRGEKDAWGFDPPEEKLLWKDGDDWKVIEKRPKYKSNFSIVSKADAITDLLKTQAHNFSKAENQVVLISEKVSVK